MKRFLGLACACLFLQGTWAGTSCATDGSSATYVETISGASGSNPKRTVTTTGCPNHYSLCTGKAGKTGCGSTGKAGTATEATDQAATYNIMAKPVLATTTTDTTCTMGAIAFAFNGVAIYGPAVTTNPCALLDVTTSSGTGAEWTSFDFCSGHVSGTGMYHYHFPPSCLIAQLKAQISTTSPTAIQAGHSPQVGWALDGFPIYGPKGIGGVTMISCTTSSANSPYCTDSCGGLEMEIPTLDNFKYRYYMQGNTSDLSSLPSYPKPDSSYYPYATACRRGCTWTEYQKGTCTGSTGVTTSYTVSVVGGYTTAGYTSAATTSSNHLRGV